MLKDKVLSPESHGACIVCSSLAANPFSLGLTFAAQSETTVMAEFTPSKYLQGYQNVLHGGIISTLMDAAMVHCLFARGVEAMTAELNVRFIKPVLVNVPVRINASLIKSKWGLFELESSLLQEGEMKAKAKARFMKT